MIVRFGLGLGESDNFPARTKATAEWFPQTQRALATGAVNARTNIGAVLAAAARAAHRREKRGSLAVRLHDDIGVQRVLAHHLATGLHQTRA